jgi:hypothetical protein
VTGAEHRPQPTDLIDPLVDAILVEVVTEHVHAAGTGQVVERALPSRSCIIAPLDDVHEAADRQVLARIGAVNGALDRGGGTSGLARG